MDDLEIVSMFLLRNEQAVQNAQNRYGAYCRTIAMRILANEDDAAECVNDVWLAAWNSIPPNEPERLSTYLGKLTRNIAIDKVRSDRAAKRCTGEYALSLDELAEVLPDQRTTEKEIQGKELERAVSTFVQTLPEVQQRVFLCRYWYFDPISEIAKRFGFSDSKVKSLLHRVRGKLKVYLKQEGLL